MSYKSTEKLSQSTWKPVKHIYDTIHQYQFYDTDYWYSLGGDELNIYLSGFSETDWKKLEEDLSFWNAHQKEILSIILTRHNEFVNKNINKDFFIVRKKALYTYLLYISDDQLFIDLIDDIEFIRLDKRNDLEILRSIQQRLLKLKITSESTNSDNSFYAPKRIDDFLSLIDHEIKKANIH